MKEGIIGKEGEVIFLDGLKEQLKLSPGTRFFVEPIDNGAFILRKVEADARKVYIELTSRCNLSCRTCMRNTWDEEMGDMSRDLFEKLLAQRKDLPEWEVLSIGGFGEPLMHPDIFDFITMAREAGLEVEMITNGLLLTPEYAERLIDTGLNRLTISIDGFDEYTYEDIRLGSDLPTVLSNIRYIEKARRRTKNWTPHMGLEFVLMKRNLEELQKVANLAVELKLTYFITTNVIPYSDELKDEILYDGSFEGTLPVPTVIAELGRPYVAYPQMQLRTERYCQFVNSNSLVVTWDGKVSPCYALMHSYPCYIMGREKQMRRHHFGDANSQSLLDIWTSEDYIRFRGKVRSFDFPSCTDCALRDGCPMTRTNEIDCWANSPSCADCLWARNIIKCP